MHPRPPPGLRSGSRSASQMAAAFSATCSISFSSNPSERPRTTLSSVAEQHPPPPRAERTAGLVSVPFPTIRLQLGLAAHRASATRFPTSGGKKTTSLIGRRPEISHPRLEKLGEITGANINRYTSRAAPAQRGLAREPRRRANSEQAGQTVPLALSTKAPCGESGTPLHTVMGLG